ncbi:MAG: acyltransferase family protein [Syntrophorhabdaceae bacterium]
MSSNIAHKQVTVKLAAEKSIQRMYYLDNLRLSFTFLVILHHVCLTYTGEQGWYYYDKIEDPFTNLLMTLLMTINRNWVLSCFFLISGYFTPGSLDKKGFAIYLKERFLRIGVPLTIFAIMVRPLIYYFLHRDTLSMKTYFFTGSALFLKNIAPGPAWFLEALLIFSLLYGIGRTIGKSLRSGPSRLLNFPGTGWIFLFISILAFCTYSLHIFLPHNKEIFHLRLGNFAEYAAFFAVGIFAWRNKWIDTLTDSIGRQWTFITSIAVAAYAAIVIFSWHAQEDLAFLRGGYSLRTFIATYIGTLIAVGSSISLIYIFRTFLNMQSGFVKSLTRDAYAVFIFHAPVLIFVTYLIQPMKALPFLKFLIAFIGGCGLCFLICRYVVRNIPFTDKIL